MPTLISPFFFSFESINRDLLLNAANTDGLQEQSSVMGSSLHADNPKLVSCNNNPAATKNQAALCSDNSNPALGKQADLNAGNSQAIWDVLHAYVQWVAHRPQKGTCCKNAHTWKIEVRKMPLYNNGETVEQNICILKTSKPLVSMIAGIGGGYHLHTTTTRGAKRIRRAARYASGNANSNAVNTYVAEYKGWVVGLAVLR